MGMASSAAIVHQILHSQTAASGRPASPDGVQQETRILRAILRITHGMEMAWSRVAGQRSR